MKCEGNGNSNEDSKDEEDDDEDPSIVKAFGTSGWTQARLTVRKHGTTSTARASSDMSPDKSIRSSLASPLARVSKKSVIFIVNWKRRFLNWPQYKKRTHECVASKTMAVISVVFTVYALCGDDVRLVATNRPSDSLFNVMALLCLTFFTVEISLKTVSQNDYFMGFFFILDVVSTASLVLDLTWVADAMNEDSIAAGPGDRARSGRTARVGASMGRVVRVIRLVRILKLYKAWFERRQTRKRKKKNTQSPCLQRTLSSVFDEENDSEDDDGTNGDGESAVGRKLAGLTTRKVILLVLLMLMAMPFLMVPWEVLYSDSANWGADRVWEAFLHRNASTSARLAYEESMLKYLYYHNWFDGQRGSCVHGDECAAMYYSQVFWVGLSASRENTGLYSEAKTAQIREDSIASFEQTFESTADYMYRMGPMPSQVHDLVSHPWIEKCSYGGWEHLGFSILKQEIEGIVDYPVRCPTELRVNEVMRVSPLLLTQDSFEYLHLAFFFDLRPLVQVGAAMGMVTTVFVCLVLMSASIVFSMDANALVLRPIERMVAKVQIIRHDPLQAISMADRVWEVEQAKRHRAQRSQASINSAGNVHHDSWRVSLKAIWAKLFQPKADEAVAETAILEQTIIKLGTLLALGFGHAGVRIVSVNMTSLDSAGIKAMIPGLTVECVIGYVKIANFSITTEVLQTKVMTFVNQIAEIVHGIATEYYGNVNRNDGDTFVAIWKVEDRKTSSRLANMSLLAFARILAQVHRSPVLARYRRHPGLRQRLDFHKCVDLSFGLHLGWAIEGAVGSDFKVDASYLSPNATIAESIEKASHIFGVHILASHSVVRLCSPNVAQFCRLIDRVQIHGSKVPIELFSFDVNPLMVEVAPRAVIDWNTRQRFRARQLREYNLARKILLDDQELVEECSEEFIAMTVCYTEEFVQLFVMGWQNYSEGEWHVARPWFVRTRDMLGFRDGPSHALLTHMQAFDFNAPKNWNGVRKVFRDVSR